MPRGREAIVVVRKPKVDRLKTQPGDEPERFTVPGCHVLPRASQEQGRGWIQIAGHSIYAPADTVAREVPDGIKGEDQIEVRGILEPIVGRPGDLRKNGKPTWVAITTEGVT